MQKLINGFVVTAILAASSFSLQAESSITFIPTTGLYQKNLEYGRSYLPDPATADFVTFMVSGTAVYKSVYSTLEYNTAITKGVLSDNTGRVDVNNAITLTIGCNCLSGAERLNIFAGYTRVMVGIAGRELSTGSGTVQVDEESTDAGLFFGASYPVFFTETGQFSVSVGYASLKGSLDFFGVTNGDTANGDSFVFNGSTTGLSFGLGWSSILSEHLNYSLSLKLQDYIFITDPVLVAESPRLVLPLQYGRRMLMGGVNVTYFF